MGVRTYTISIHIVDEFGPPRLVHEPSDARQDNCGWADPNGLVENRELVFDGQTIELRHDVGGLSFEEGTQIVGDWGDEDEVPNCPECGAYILVEVAGGKVSPWEFFASTQVTL